MAAVYIGVGSNIEPEANIAAAFRLLRQRARIVAISTFYRTDPLGSGGGAPEFYNGVVKLETDIEPRDLKYSVLRQIEETLGRHRGPDRYAPRTIDLDIILYGNVVVREPGLAIPDPDVRTRPFIAVPLAELAPDLELPDSGTTAREIARQMQTESMSALDEFTQALRQEFCG